MVYVKIAWVDGSDADYLCFLTLEEAAEYLVDEVDYVISDNLIDNIPEDNYNFDPAP